MKKILLGLTFLSALLWAASCTKKTDIDVYYYEKEDYDVISQYLTLPELPPKYETKFPSHLSSVGLFPRPVNSDIATLGRVLFYDKNLSKDQKISCASCHKQSLGFADNAPVSKGVYGRVGERNSFALSSVANFSAYYGTDLNGASALRFSWDNRRETAADQSEGAMTNEKEMAMHMDEITAAVKAQPYYPTLFKKAFASTDITRERILEGLASFVNAMGSYQSRFDTEADKIVGSNGYYTQAKMVENFSGFTPAENRGKALFMQHCASCHTGNMGRPTLFHANNGLDATTTDEGVGGITGNPQEMSSFKVPTLRNIALTAPYMHDGRFSTLEEVIEHYNSGIKAHPNLHNNLKSPNGQPFRLNLSKTDKDGLKAFLLTLTDEKLMNDARFSDPFKQ